MAVRGFAGLHQKEYIESVSVFPPPQDCGDPMKLPSIRTLLERSRTTLTRFPFVLGVALVGSVSAVLLLEGEEVPTPLGNVLTNLLLACALGLPLLLAIALIGEKGKMSRARLLV